MVFPIFAMMPVVNFWWTCMDDICGSTQWSFVAWGNPFAEFDRGRDCAVLATPFTTESLPLIPYLIRAGSPLNGYVLI